MTISLAVKMAIVYPTVVFVASVIFGNLTREHIIAIKHDHEIRTPWRGLHWTQCIFMMLTNLMNNAFTLNQVEVGIFFAIVSAFFICGQIVSFLTDHVYAEKLFYYAFIVSGCTQGFYFAFLDVVLVIPFLGWQVNLWIPSFFLSILMALCIMIISD